MATRDDTGARPLEPAALRAFKALLIATGSVGALSALGLVAARVAEVDVSPKVVVGLAFTIAINVGFESIKAVAVGRARLGLQDALARRLAGEAYAVARQEPGGAWVVLRGESTVQVLDKAGFESLLADRMVNDAYVLKVVRPEGDGFRVERWQGGVIRSADVRERGGHAIERFDRKGRLVGFEDVEATMPGFPIRGVAARVRDGGAFEFTPLRSPSRRGREAPEARGDEGPSTPGMP